IRDPKVRPEVVVYDVALTKTLPAKLAATSGVNAIAHGVEALYARDRNPIIEMIAFEGITALVAALPELRSTGADDAACAQALYGAWLCGIALGSSAMALHHKLCHILGGAFDLPHADTHAIVLPHAVAYNAVAVPDLLRPLAELLAELPGAG